MPRRSELKGIANNLASSFVSRNNDVGGYWALGRLYLYAKQSSQLNVHIALTPRLDSIVGEPIGCIARSFEKKLEQLLRSQGLPRAWLTAANVLIEFESASAKPRFFGHHVNGRPFLCRVSLSDELGRLYDASTTGWCWPHNPTIESQSTRAQSDA